MPSEAVFLLLALPGNALLLGSIVVVVIETVIISRRLGLSSLRAGIIVVIGTIVSVIVRLILGIILSTVVETSVETSFAGRIADFVFPMDESLLAGWLSFGVFALLRLAITTLAESPVIGFGAGAPWNNDIRSVLKCSLAANLASLAFLLACGAAIMVAGGTARIVDPGTSFWGALWLVALP